jgi:hypothetical protein
MAMPFGLGGNWIKTEGVVVATRDTGSKQFGTWRQEYVVEVHPQGEAPFRAAIKWPFVDLPGADFWPPSNGETIGIEYDPKSHELRWDKSDPRTNLLAKTPAAEKAKQNDAFADALAGKTAVPAAASDPDTDWLNDQGGDNTHQQVPDDGKQGLSFQFDANGRPVAGQAESVVSAVASGQMRTIRGKADEVLATGTHGTAEITTAQPLGKTVRDINPNADPSRLNDPMWLFTVQVSLAGQQPFPAVFGHRVPLTKLATVAPGVTLAVAVDMADPHNTVAIDWDRSPIS